MQSLQLASSYRSLVAEGLEGPSPYGADGLGRPYAVVGDQDLLDRVVAAGERYEVIHAAEEARLGQWRELVSVHPWSNLVQHLVDRFGELIPSWRRCVVIERYLR